MVRPVPRLHASSTPPGEGIHLIVDSTGLSIVGDGEWDAPKHGKSGTRDWKKLHLGVNGSGVIVAQPLAGGHFDDATTAISLIDWVEGESADFTADAGYDAIAFYDSAGAHGTKAVVPPARAATVSRRRPRSSARDRTIKKVTEIGRRQWKTESDYHRQARVENAYFRYKSIIEDGPRDHAPGAQAA